MSDTAAAGPVAVLAQGLRELRDNAEGPDGVELELLTSLDPDVIGEALRGAELPTLGVTLSLVDAWGGDVEAWALYWSQINEIAVEAQAAAPQPDDRDDRSDRDGNEPGGKGDSGRRAPVEPVVPVKTKPEPVAIPEPTRAESAAEPPSKPADKGEQAGKTAPAPTAVADQASTSKPSEAAQESKTDGAATGKSKSSTKSKSKSQDKPRRTPTIIGILVVAAAATGGFFAYTAVRHDDKAKDASVTGGASVTKTPSPSGSAAGRTPTPSPAKTSESTSSASVTSAPTGASYQPGEVIGAYSQVQLPSGYSVDFLNDPSHPSYGTGANLESLGFQAASSPGSEASASESSGGGPAASVSGKFLAGQVVVFDANEAGTLERCQNDTRYQSDVDLAQLSVGAQFCVHTPGGRLALVRVDRLPDPADVNPYVVIDVTVWQGP